jgi:hypothetical protein
MLAVSTNQPEIVKLLLDRGADDTFNGYCMGPRRGVWMCGSALGMARQSGSHPDIIAMLESRVGKSATVEGTGKSDWRGIIRQQQQNEIGASDENREEIGSDSKLHDQIQQLKMDPNYLTPEQIEREQSELEDRRKILELKIEISREIETRIRSLQDLNFETKIELKRTLRHLSSCCEEG